MLTIPLCDFLVILPESLLLLTGLLSLLFSFTPPFSSPGSFRKCTWLSIIGFFSSFLSLFLIHQHDTIVYAFSERVVMNDFVFWSKMLGLGSSAVAFFLSCPTLIRRNLMSFEYASLILIASAGMLFAISANDLLYLFIGLCLQNMIFPVLIATKASQGKASQASIKLFILTTLSMAFYLYGTSFLYGFCGTLNFASLGNNLAIQTPLPLGVYLGSSLIIASLIFKMGIAPFHMWLSDVCEGCPTPIVLFLLTAPQTTALIVLINLLHHPFFAIEHFLSPLLCIFAISSILIGTFASLQQSSFKRLLAYVTIIQMGYMLMSLSCGQFEGIQGVFVALFVYLVAILGSLGCLLALQGKTIEGVSRLNDLAGLGKHDPLMAFLITIFMLSLAGMPPFAGFFGRFYILRALVLEKHLALGAAILILSVFGTVYCIRLIKIMYFNTITDSGNATYKQTFFLSLEAKLSLTVCAAVTLFLCFYAQTFDIIRQASLLFQH